jgi:hypothetical protein
MRYRLGMKDDGWLVVDTEHRRVARYGGLKLEGLSAEEAHVMVGLVEAYDRGTDGSDVTPVLQAYDRPGTDMRLA